MSLQYSNSPKLEKMESQATVASATAHRSLHDELAVVTTTP